MISVIPLCLCSFSKISSILAISGAHHLRWDAPRCKNLDFVVLSGLDVRTGSSDTLQDSAARSLRTKLFTRRALHLKLSTRHYSDPFHEAGRLNSSSEIGTPSRQLLPFLGWPRGLALRTRWVNSWMDDSKREESRLKPPELPLTSSLAGFSWVLAACEHLITSFPSCY